MGEGWGEGNSDFGTTYSSTVKRFKTNSRIAFSAGKSAVNDLVPPVYFPGNVDQLANATLAGFPRTNVFGATL